MSSEHQNKIECRGLSSQAQEERAYLAFAREAFGAHSIQANPTFLTWLYKENPNSLGRERDLIVLVDGEKIVGSHHRMRIPWRINGKHFAVPSLHDLFVLEHYRAAAPGQGFMPPSLKIMLAAHDREPHVSVFGLTEAGDKIYERIRVPSVELSYLCRVRSKLRIGIQMAATRFGLTLHRKQQSARHQIESHGHQVTRIGAPTTDEIAEALSIVPPAQSYPDWNADSYRWRFFHEIGPGNILFLARKNGSLTGRAVLSVGLKRDAIVGRIVDLVFQNPESLDALLAALEDAIRQLGIFACFAATNSAEALLHLRALGWDNRKEVTGARWVTMRGEERPNDLWIVGGAWDYGCDVRVED